MKPEPNLLYSYIFLLLQSIVTVLAVELSLIDIITSFQVAVFL